MKSRIYTIIGIIALLVIGSGIITYTPRDTSHYVLTKVNKKGHRKFENRGGAYWVTIKEIANLELGNYEVIIGYHNGTIDASEIDFSENSTTLIGYEKVSYQYYRGFKIIDDHMDGLNSKYDTFYELLSCLRSGGKITW